MCSSGTARLRPLASGLVAWAAVLVALGTGDARADCALIDSATRQLESTYGAIAQPYGSPTREVTIFNPVECNPDASNFAFAPVKAENRVTITWLPRDTLAPVPDPMELTTADFELDQDDCNEQNTRCTTLRVTIPDTTGVVSNGVTGPFTGPASIVVRNTNVNDDLGTPDVDESISAQIDDLFEPTRSCNSDNRHPNLFRHFSILPPDNLFEPGPEQRSAFVTADGGDGVLVPMDWSPALFGSSSGEARFRIVHIVSTTLVVGPGDVRAFTTDTGEPLPPILEINQAGDAVTGSIDFPFSVTRLNLPLLAASAAATPTELTGLTYEALAAGPLNSITPTDQLVGLARDETLEGDIDGDGIPDSRLVSFIDKASGGVIDTGQKVMESSRSPLKAVLEGNGDLLAFCQSEAHEREKISGDNDLEDCIARLFDGSGTDLSENLIATADPTANFNGPNAFGVGPNYAFFLRNELHEASYELVHASADAAGQFLDPPAGSATHPSLDDDVVYFISDAGAALAPVVPPTGGSVVWETASIPWGTAFGLNNFLVFNGFTFNAGVEEVPGVDLAGCTIDDDGLQISFLESGSSALTGTFEGLLTDRMGGDCFVATIPLGQGSYVVVPGPGGDEFDPLVPGTMIHAVGPLDVQVLSDPLPPGLTNFQIIIDLEVLTVGLFDFTFQGSFALLADDGTATAGGSLVFRRDLGAGTTEMVSVNGLGVASDGDCSAPSAGGGKVAYACDSTNMGASNGFRNVFVHDPAFGSTDLASPGQTTSCDGPSLAADASAVGFACGGEIVLRDLGASITTLIAADDGSGASFDVHVNADATCAVFSSDNQNLDPDGPDTNGFSDVYFWSAAGLERISRAVTGGPGNGDSLQATVSDDCRYVGFRSSAANLLADPVTSNHAVQCYVHDRLKTSTQIVSLSLAGEGADGGCFDPRMSGDAHYMSFRSNSGNLTGGGAGFDRTYRTNRISGITTEMSADAAGTPADAASLGAADISPDGQSVALASLGNLLLGDGNGASDVFLRRLTAAPDLDANGEHDDRLLYALAADGTGLVASDVAVTEVATAGDLAAFIQEGSQRLGFFTPGSPTPTLFPAPPVTAVALALTDQVLCAVSTSNELLIGDPANPTGNLVGQGIPADAVGAVDDKCVFISPESLAGDLDGDLVPDDRVLQYIQVTLPLAVYTPVNTMRGAVEFQVSSRGIAYRHPEDGTDENGDDDGVDLVMEFWDTDPAATDPLIETQRSAILCKFPGCDPFFEPYSVKGPYLSFVTLEVGDENDSNNVIGVECLPGAALGECDVTADGDNNDFAIVVFSLEAQQAQIFPVAPEEAATITTTPLADADGTVNINGALCGDDDGDGTLGCDGIENEQFRTIDNCPGVQNGTQADNDRDGMGVLCDVGAGDANDDDVAGFRTCDLDSPLNGVDADDIGQIFADRGTAGGDFDFATGEFLDSRNNDRDAFITVLDARQCAVLCETNPSQDPINCWTAQSASWAPPEPAPSPTFTLVASGPWCGLLGIEPVLVLILARRRGSRKGRAWRARI